MNLSREQRRELELARKAALKALDLIQAGVTTLEEASDEAREIRDNELTEEHTAQAQSFADETCNVIAECIERAYESIEDLWTFSETPE